MGTGQVPDHRSATMGLTLKCRCGQVKGVLEPSAIHARVTCYCRDCQGWAHWLGTPGLLDPRGGTDVVVVTPGLLRLESGREHLACATFSGKVLRWYASCCRTPLANTGARARPVFATLSTDTMDAAALAAAAGPPARAVAHRASATAPVRPTPLALAAAVARTALGLLGARLRGHQDSPFFDPASGAPLRAPQSLARPAPEDAR